MDRGTVMAVKQTDGGEVKKMCSYSSFILKADLVVVNFFSMGRRWRERREREGEGEPTSCLALSMKKIMVPARRSTQMK